MEEENSSKIFLAAKEIFGTRKAELHAHLNGCIPPTLVAELKLRPQALERTTILEPVSGMKEYFEPWTVFRELATSAEATERIVQVAASYLAADKVVYAELRNSIRHIATLNDISLETTIEWLSAAMETASARTGVDLRLVVSLTREHFSDELARQMLTAIRTVSSERVVGIDLTGDEMEPVPREASRHFRMARDDLGLGVTIHAGETGPPGNIVWAIEECGAARIGHGVAAAASPECLDLIRERGVCIEVCLSSNFLTRSVDSLDSHPVQRFDAEGLEFVLCTDNPQMHLRSLSFEYELFSSICPDSSALDTQFEKQMRYAFAQSPGGGLRAT